MATRFQQWLRDRGVARTAREIGVTQQAASRWANGHGEPRPQFARLMLELAARDRSPLTLNDIYPAPES